MNDYAIFNNLKMISPYVRYVRVSEKSGGFSGEWINDDNIFTFIKEGKVDFIFDGHKYTCEKGEAVIMPPFLPHIVKQAKKTEKSIQYVCHFDMIYDPLRTEKKVHDVIKNGIRWKKKTNSIENIFNNVAGIISPGPREGSLIKESFLKLHNEFFSGRIGADLICKGYITEILGLYLQSVFLKETPKGTKIKAWKNLEAAIDYIHMNFDHADLSVNLISNAAGLTPNYLSTVFKREIGVPIHRYINEIRLSKAKELMLEPGKRFTEIAHLVGFSTIHSFSKVFSQYTGMSPSEFLSSTGK